MISISKTGCGQSLHNCSICFHYTGLQLPACRQLTCTYKFNLKRFWKALYFDFSMDSRLRIDRQLSIQVGDIVVTIKYYTPKEIKGWFLNWGKGRTSSAGDSEGKHQYEIHILFFTILGFNLEVSKFIYTKGIEKTK